MSNQKRKKLQTERFGFARSRSRLTDDRCVAVLRFALHDDAIFYLFNRIHHDDAQKKHRGGTVQYSNSLENGCRQRYKAADVPVGLLFAQIICTVARFWAEQAGHLGLQPPLPNFAAPAIKSLIRRVTALVLASFVKVEGCVFYDAFDPKWGTI